MTKGAAPTVLFVPGLRDYAADHWQTLMQAKIPGSLCVPRRAENKLSCAAWVEDLHHSISAIRGPIVLVAHSGGVMMVAHWARKYQARIAGALLATPPDFSVPLPEGYPTQETLRTKGWMPVPMQPLPFPSLVAVSTNDPLARMDRVVGMARAWGSRIVTLGEVGHLNPASGYGEWAQGLSILRAAGFHALTTA